MILRALMLALALTLIVLKIAHRIDAQWFVLLTFTWLVSKRRI